MDEHEKLEKMEKQKQEMGEIPEDPFLNIRSRSRKMTRLPVARLKTSRTETTEKCEPVQQPSRPVTARSEKPSFSGSVESSPLQSKGNTTEGSNSFSSSSFSFKLEERQMIFELEKRKYEAAQIKVE